jgi:alcohol dehydrogenase class IV
VCAALLPAAMEINLRALKRRMPGSAALEKYHEIARLLTGHSTAQADDGVRWVRALTKELGIPPLASYGIKAGDTGVLAERASVASSTKGNPVKLEQDELNLIVEMALGY